jgi:hypothetical protein
MQRDIFCFFSMLSVIMLNVVAPSYNQECKRGTLSAKILLKQYDLFRRKELILKIVKSFHEYFF